MTDVFYVLNVVVGEIKHLQLSECLQSFDFDDLVIVELQFDQVGQLAKTSHQHSCTHYCRN